MALSPPLPSHTADAQVPSSLPRPILALFPSLCHRSPGPSSDLILSPGSSLPRLPYLEDSFSFYPGNCSSLKNQVQCPLLQEALPDTLRKELHPSPPSLAAPNCPSSLLDKGGRLVQATSVWRVKEQRPHSSFRRSHGHGGEARLTKKRAEVCQGSETRLEQGGEEWPRGCWAEMRQGDKCRGVAAGESQGWSGHWVLSLEWESPQEMVTKGLPGASDARLRG